jgi:hypothetical protein
LVRARYYSNASSKSTRIELYQVVDEKLKLIAETPFAGKILTMQLVKGTRGDVDGIFVTTERWTFHLLRWNAETSTFRVEAAGEAFERAGMLGKFGQFATVDPDNRLAIVHVYESQLRVIPFYTEKYSKYFARDDPRGKAPKAPFKIGEVGASFTIRLKEMHIVDLKLLHSRDSPTLAVLYKQRDDKFVQMYSIVPNKDKDPIAGAKVKVENMTSMLIPLTNAQGAGVLAIGQQSITHIDEQGGTRTIPMNYTIMKWFVFLSID